MWWMSAVCLVLDTKGFARLCFSLAGGCGSFYAIHISSPQFKGLSTIKQHKLVNQCLKEEVKAIHGLQVSRLFISRLPCAQADTASFVSAQDSARRVIDPTDPMRVLALSASLPHTILRG